MLIYHHKCFQPNYQYHHPNISLIILRIYELFPLDLFLVMNDPSSCRWKEKGRLRNVFLARFCIFLVIVVKFILCHLN